MKFVLAPADNVVYKCCGCHNDLCLFGLMLNVSVNTYGHARTVSSPNHTFVSWASLTKRLTNTLCTYFRL